MIVSIILKWLDRMDSHLPVAAAALVDDAVGVVNGTG